MRKEELEYSNHSLKTRHPTNKILDVESKGKKIFFPNKALKSRKKRKKNEKGGKKFKGNIKDEFKK